VSRFAGLAGVIPAVIMTMAGWGLIGPNALALAMQRYPQSAGAASAVVGFLQFTLGAIAAPLPGLRGTTDPLPMAILLAAFPLAAILTVLAFSVRPGRSTIGDAIPAEPVIAD
jgi:DHA1 family bicyclomycin/chloramphenicol resistance-like MFS transporter